MTTQNTRENSLTEALTNNGVSERYRGYIDQMLSDFGYVSLHDSIVVASYELTLDEFDTKGVDEHYVTVGGQIVQVTRHYFRTQLGTDTHQIILASVSNRFYFLLVEHPEEVAGLLNKTATSYVLSDTFEVNSLT